MADSTTKRVIISQTVMITESIGKLLHSCPYSVVNESCYRKRKVQKKDSIEIKDMSCLCVQSPMNNDELKYRKI